MLNSSTLITTNQHIFESFEKTLDSMRRNLAEYSAKKDSNQIAVRTRYNQLQQLENFFELSIMTIKTLETERKEAYKKGFADGAKKNETFDHLTDRETIRYNTIQRAMELWPQLY